MNVCVCVCVCLCVCVYVLARGGGGGGEAGLRETSQIGHRTYVRLLLLCIQ